MKQLMNNNPQNSHIKNWFQTATLLKKWMMPEPPEYSFLCNAERDSRVKKPRTINYQHQNPFNPLFVLNLSTNPHTILTVNIINPNSNAVVNITGCLIKKRKHTSDPILINHFKWQKDNNFPIMEYEGCPLTSATDIPDGQYKSKYIIKMNSY